MKMPSLNKRADKQEAGAEVVEKKSGFDFQVLLNDFKTLDPSDPGLWPAAPRAVILLGLFAALIAAAWLLGWDTQLEELNQKVTEETTLREDWSGKKKQAVNLDAYRKQLQDIGNSFGTLLEQLPNQTEIGDLLVDINKAAQGRGLVVELFKPGPEIRKDFYAEKPITMKLVGGYHDLASFASDIAQLPRIVTLNDLDLTVVAASSPTPGGDSKDATGDVKMTLNTKAQTFRYLDEAELASIKKAAAGKKVK